MSESAPKHHESGLLPQAQSTNVSTTMKIRITKLTTDEKQSLLGPTVIGCLLGAFAAYAVFAFASEYQLQGAADANTWTTTAEAILAFVASVAGTVGILGLAPLIVGRVRSQRGDA